MTLRGHLATATLGAGLAAIAGAPGASADDAVTLTSVFHKGCLDHLPDFVASAETMRGMGLTNVRINQHSHRYFGRGLSAETPLPSPQPLPRAACSVESINHTTDTDWASFDAGVAEVMGPPGAARCSGDLRLGPAICLHSWPGDGACHEFSAVLSDGIVQSAEIATRRKTACRP